MGVYEILSQTAVPLIWLALYHYYLEQVCELEKGWGKRLTVWGMTFGGMLAVQGIGAALQPAGAAWMRVGAWLAVTLILFLYVLFYDAKPLRTQWGKALAPGFFCCACSFAPYPGQAAPAAYAALSAAVFLGFLLLLQHERGRLRTAGSVFCMAAYGLLGFYAWSLGTGGPEAETVGMETGSSEAGVLVAGIFILEFLLFGALEGTLASYHRGFASQAEVFQRDILGQQYREIREIYLDMRGWRHDYHNHLQVMKAQLAAGRTREARQYLDDLEQALDRVDSTVKSGNLMADAILNSKLTLAGKKGIRVNCKAVLPASLSIEDVDLCVLLGNLLDNALEACEKIPPDQRFLRIYMAVNGSQLYISVQNSAKEELNFNERNYISQKRGRHGLGMKRVKALTDKYDGYLTLANEPGIFAAEATLPL